MYLIKCIWLVGLTTLCLGLVQEVPQEYGGKGAPLVPLADESAELITVT